MPGLHDEMSTGIERIVDRKMIKQRVQYYVVWKGFGEENNTWESRVDLIADGYSNVIKAYEEQRKNELKTSTPRGRSPGRPASKSPRTKSRSPGRGPSRSRTRRSRSRSVSVSRKLSMNSKDDAEQSTSSYSSTTTRQRKKSPSDNLEHKKDSNIVAKDTSGRRSTRKTQTVTETSEFVCRLDAHKIGDPMVLDEEEDSVLLRSTIAALTPGVHGIAPLTPLELEREVLEKSVVLSYEAGEESEMPFKHSALKSEEAASPKASPSSVSAIYEDAHPILDGSAAKPVTSSYLMSFLSAAIVIGSLVASHMLPREDEQGSDLWQRWLPFLTSVVALLLFFHQKDAHVSAKWVATSLAWRATAELLLLIGTTPREFKMMVAGSAFVANVSLLIAFVSILRNGEHEQSKATLALLGVGALALFLSDSWVISTEDTELESRVTLMSIAVLTIALSPLPSASLEDEEEDRAHQAPNHLKL